MYTYIYIYIYIYVHLVTRRKPERFVNCFVFVFGNVIFTNVLATMFKRFICMLHEPFCLAYPTPSPNVFCVFHI